MAEIKLREANTFAANNPGWYVDPESGARLHVVNPAGADALARMGWKQITGTNEDFDSLPNAKPIVPPAAPAQPEPEEEKEPDTAPAPVVTNTTQKGK